MKRFTRRRRHVDLETFYGVVAGSNKFSETHVWGSGGGGSGGNTSSVRISSTAVTNQEFFIRNPGGEERVVKLKGLDIPVRDGQHVTMLTAGVQKKGYYNVRLVNHNVDRYWDITNEKFLVNRWGLVHSKGLRAIVSMVTIFPTILVLPKSLSESALAIVIAGNIGYWIYQEIKKISVAKQLAKYLDEYSGFILSGQSTKLVMEPVSDTDDSANSELLTLGPALKRITGSVKKLGESVLSSAPKSSSRKKSSSSKVIKKSSKAKAVKKVAASKPRKKVAVSKVAAKSSGKRTVKKTAKTKALKSPRKVVKKSTKLSSKKRKKIVIKKAKATKVKAKPKKNNTTSAKKKNSSKTAKIKKTSKKSKR